MTIASDYLSSDQSHQCIAFNTLNGRSVALFYAPHSKIYYLVTTSIWWEEEKYTNEALTMEQAYEFYSAGDLTPQLPPHQAFPAMFTLPVANRSERAAEVLSYAG